MHTWTSSLSYTLILYHRTSPTYSHVPCKQTHHLYHVGLLCIVIHQPSITPNPGLYSMELPIKSLLQDTHSPLVAVVSSPEADAIVQQADGLTMAELCRPFGQFLNLNSGVGGVWEVPLAGILWWISSDHVLCVTSPMHGVTQHMPQQRCCTIHNLVHNPHNPHISSAYPPPCLSQFLCVQWVTPPFVYTNSSCAFMQQTPCMQWNPPLLSSTCSGRWRMLLRCMTNTPSLTSSNTSTKVQDVFVYMYCVCSV